ncbi:MAG TPA: nuclear transport factor 2 family protein [Solirubrobacteraceae bacterium]|jgi:ketosteroid isomerase-like protein
MSQENVEMVRGLLPAPDVDIAQLFRDDMLWAALVAAVAPALRSDFECFNRGLPGGEGRTYKGLDGLRVLWLDWLAPWATYRTEIEDAIDLGEHVLVPVRDFARPQESAQEVAFGGAAVWTVRDGKIAQIGFYTSRHEALKAVGLEE